MVEREEQRGSAHKAAGEGCTGEGGGEGEGQEVAGAKGLPPLAPPGVQAIVRAAFILFVFVL